MVCWCGFERFAAGGLAGIVLLVYWGLGFADFGWFA